MSQNSISTEDTLCLPSAKQLVITSDVASVLDKSFNNVNLVVLGHETFDNPETPAAPSSSSVLTLTDLAQLQFLRKGAEQLHHAIETIQGSSVRRHEWSCGVKSLLQSYILTDWVQPLMDGEDPETLWKSSRLASVTQIWQLCGDDGGLAADCQALTTFDGNIIHDVDLSNSLEIFLVRKHYLDESSELRRTALTQAKDTGNTTHLLEAIVESRPSCLSSPLVWRSDQPLMDAEVRSRITASVLSKLRGQSDMADAEHLAGEEAKLRDLVYHTVTSSYDLLTAAKKHLGGT